MDFDYPPFVILIGVLMALVLVIIPGKKSLLTKGYNGIPVSANATIVCPGVDPIYEDMAIIDGKPYLRPLPSFDVLRGLICEATFRLTDENDETETYIQRVKFDTLKTLIGGL